MSGYNLPLFPDEHTAYLFSFTNIVSYILVIPSLSMVPNFTVYGYLGCSSSAYASVLRLHTYRSGVYDSLHAHRPGLQDARALFPYVLYAG